MNQFFTLSNRFFLPSPSNLKTSFLVLIIFALSSPTVLLGQQISWDGGGADNNWNTADNWSTNTVPTATNTVRISGSSSEVTIPAGYSAVAQDVYAESGGTLTVEATAELSIGNSGAFGIRVGSNSTLNNDGTINSNNNIGARALALTSSSAVCNNNGTMNFDNTGNNFGGDGIYLDGTLNNNGDINIGPNITQDGIEMLSNGKLNNSAEGVIAILSVGAGQDGIEDNGSNQSITNEGTICIEDANVDGQLIAPGISYTGNGILKTSGCLAPKCDLKFDLETTILDTEKGVDGSNLYVVEICGGTLPYELSFDNETPQNFATVDMYPGNTTDCRKLRIFYGDGAQWTATISDNNECTAGVSISYLDVANEEEIEIVEFTSTQESKAGYSNGTARVEVEGGNDPYGVYTYEWRGPLNTITVTDGSDGNEQMGLTAGIYTVIVTDAANNSQTISGVVKRNRWGGIGRGRSGKTALEQGGELFLSVAPNPFEDYSTVQFQTPVEESISIDVFSLSGQHVANLFEGQTNSDSLQSVPFDRGSLQAGTYLIRLVTDSGTSQHQKVVVM